MGLGTEMAQEIDENRFRHHLGERFFWSGPFFARFLGPTWVPDWLLWADFWPTFATFWRTVGHHVICLRSKMLGEAPGIDFGCPGSLPARILRGLQGFWEDFAWFSASLWSFVAFYFCSNFVPSLAQLQISCCSTVCLSPLLPCPPVAGAVVSRSALNSPDHRSRGVLDPGEIFHSVRYSI